MLAALCALALETDRGPGYEIITFVVDQDRPDKIKLLDAISIYACNIAMSEGRPVVVSRRDKRIQAAVYGRDTLKMETREEPWEITQLGGAQAIIKNILDRRPEWRTLY
jgi:hypothetical protein